MRDLGHGSSEQRHLDLAEQVLICLRPRYEVEREIARGGMSQVFLAHDTKLDRRVAIKVLLPELSHSLAAERFLDEIHIAASLQHPHIVPVHDSGQVDGLLFYVMPYVEGETLAHQLATTGPAAIDDVVKIARDVGQALDYAHTHGVIHRDIKPQNIFLSDGIALVADFGIARALQEAGPARTYPGIAIGTPEYMSPEQIVASRQIDGRSDIYSLGCVVFEMLAGEPPVTGSTPQAVVARHLHMPPPSLRVIRPNVSQAVQTVVERALAKVPADRFATARDFVEALDRAALEQTPAAANPAIAREAERVQQAPRRWDVALARVRTIRNKRGLAWVAAVAVTVLTVLGIGLWSGARPAGSPMGDLPRLVVLPFDNVGPPPTAYVVDGFTDEINSRLARISGLYVTSRTSAGLYKERSHDKPLREIGEELDVEFALAGAVRIDTTAPGSGRIRITAELLRLSDGYRMWSDHFSSQFAPGAIFDVQSDIANQVASALNVVLLGSERLAIASHPTDNAEAFDLYLLGRSHWNKRSQSGVEQAAAYFEQAIQKDSAYALAYAGLADAYAILSAWGFALPTAVNPKAKAAALKALELDSTLAEAYVSLAWVTFVYDRDWNAAESYFRRAFELNPRYATAHHWYSIISLPLARFDTAHAAIQRARQLSPLSMIINTQVALPFYYSRQYDAALEHFLDMMAIDSLYPPLLFELGEVYMAKGMYDDALRVLARSNQISPNSRTRAVLGMAYGMAGRRDEAMAVLGELRESARQQYVPATAFAWLFIGLGEADSALFWLERAYEDRNWHLLLAGVDTHFDPLRDDPRFQELLARLNLPS